MDFIGLFKRNDISGLKKLIKRVDDINKAVILDDDDDGYDLNYLHICVAMDSDNRNKILNIIITRKDLNINAKSGHLNNYWTALHIAASCAYFDTLLLLLEYGGDPYITDINGCNVWDVASEYGNFNCIQILESYTNTELSQKFTSLFVSKKQNYEPTIIDVFDIKTLVEVESIDDNESNSSQETIIYSLSEGNESENETKIYLDTASNITFVERKIKSELDTDINDNVPIYDEWSYSLIESKRSKLGLTPVPITPSTRLIHAKNVYLIENNLSPSPIKKCFKYSEELHSFMNSGDQNSEKILALEEEFRMCFKHLKSPKNCFTYILLDPRITNNIQSQSKRLEFNCQLFEKFIESIFYIGKGQKSRPMQHLFEAVKYSGRNCQQQSLKVKRIRDIWSSGRGVVSLNCFHNICSSEALSREFCMLSAIKIENVTNIQRGNNTMRNIKWNDHKRSYFGASLLFKAYFTVLTDGEREIRPADINK